MSDDGSTSGLSRRIDARRGGLIVVAVVAVVSASVSWFVGQRIKSPAEIAAETAAPEASLITVPVEMRELSQKVVVRGTVEASEATELSVSSSEGATVIITRVPKAAGDTIAEGEVVIEVSGRPVIALGGPLPVFRNLIPGLEGPDVTQLEEALARLGHNPGPIDGVYDASTVAAVEALYTAAGFSPPEAPEADSTAVSAAQDLVTSQRSAVTAAEGALEEAGGAVSPSTRLQLDQAVTTAENNHDLAVTTSAQEKSAADAAVTEAEGLYNAAVATSTTAVDRLTQAEGGTHPDTGEAPTAGELDELRAAKRDAENAVTSASNALTSAKNNRTTTYQAQDNAVASAAAEVDLAKATRTDTLTPAGAESQGEALDEARAALEEAEADLAEAQARIGAWIPAAEVVFLSSFPREVQSVAVEVGQSPQGAVMTITGAETKISSGVSAADRQLLEVGMETLVEDDGLGISVPAVITEIADSPGGADVSADLYAMVLEPTEDLPDEALNQNLRISIPISSSGGEVLAVPLAALSAGADGTARVEIEQSDGSTEVIDVSTGLRAEGYVQIEPLDGAVINEGDRVVVGQDIDLSDIGGDEIDSDSDSEETETETESSDTETETESTEAEAEESDTETDDGES